MTSLTDEVMRGLIMMILMIKVIEEMIKLSDISDDHIQTLCCLIGD